MNFVSVIFEIITKINFHILSQFYFSLKKMKIIHFLILTFLIAFIYAGVTDTDCTSSGSECASFSNSACDTTTSKCKCSAGYKTNTAGSNCVVSVADTDCTSSGSECGGFTHAECDTSATKCKCSTGYELNTEGSDCVKEAEEIEEKEEKEEEEEVEEDESPVISDTTCSQDSDCTALDSNAVCSSTKCACKSGYTLNTAKTKCTEQKKDDESQSDSRFLKISLIYFFCLLF